MILVQSKLTVPLTTIPIFARVLDGAHRLCRLEQRLRRDAAPVQANPARALALDTGGLEAELRATNGGHVTAGACAEDDGSTGLPSISHSTNGSCAKRDRGVCCLLVAVSGRDPVRGRFGGRVSLRGHRQPNCRD